MNELIQTLVRERMLSPVLFWGGLGTFVIVLSLIKAVSTTIRSVSRERTRREIAAYIAEGSMSPEQGERLMKPGSRDQVC